MSQRGATLGVATILCVLRVLGGEAFLNHNGHRGTGLESSSPSHSPLTYSLSGAKAKDSSLLVDGRVRKSGRFEPNAERVWIDRHQRVEQMK